MSRDLYLVVKPARGEEESEFDVISTGGDDAWTARYLADDVVLLPVEAVQQAIAAARVR